jgi:hypothetical protein
MTKKRFLNVLIAVGLVFLITTPAQSHYVKTLGGSNDDNGGSVIQTSDGGFVITGGTRSYGAGDYDVLLVKFDLSGNYLWAKTLGGSNEEAGNTVIEASDGGFVVSGETQSFGAGSYDLFLSKFDASGDTLWTKTLGGPNEDRWGRVIEASDGGLVVAGWTNSSGAGGDDLLLAKFDSSGNYLWAKTLGESNEDRGYSVIEASDGSFVVAGETKSFGAGYMALLLSKFDATGDHLWTKTLGGWHYDQAYSLIEASDGGLVVTGWTHSWGAGGDDLLLCKFDASGNHLWIRTLGGMIHETGASVAEASDGGLVVTGYWSGFQSPDPDSAWVLLSKFDASGNYLWTRILGDSSWWDQGGSVIEASDRKLVVTGQTQSFGAGGDDLLLATFESSGNTCLGKFITPEVQSVSPDTASHNPTVLPWTPETATWQPTITWPDPIITIVCVTPDDIPTLTEWGLIIFGVVLVGFITYVFLKRRKAVVSYQ